MGGGGVLGLGRGEGDVSVDHTAQGEQRFAVFGARKTGRAGRERLI